MGRVDLTLASRRRRRRFALVHCRSGSYARTWRGRQCHTDSHAIATSVSVCCQRRRSDRDGNRRRPWRRRRHRNRGYRVGPSPVFTPKTVLTTVFGAPHENRTQACSVVCVPTGSPDADNGNRTTQSQLLADRDRRSRVRIRDFGFLSVYRHCRHAPRLRH